MDKLISVGKAADLLGVTTETLRQWEKHKILECQRTKGGHRRYLLSEIEKLQGKIREDKSNVVSVYCRVSSHEQKTKGDLERQKLRLLEYCSEKKYRVPWIWATINPDEKVMCNRTFRVYGTGQIGNASTRSETYISTFQLENCAMVFHVFEVI